MPLFCDIHRLFFISFSNRLRELTLLFSGFVVDPGDCIKPDFGVVRLAEVEVCLCPLASYEVARNCFAIAPACISESLSSDNTANLGFEWYVWDRSFCAERAAACLLKIVLISSGCVVIYRPSGLAARGFSDRYCEPRWLPINILFCDLLRACAPRRFYWDSPNMRFCGWSL